MPSFRHVSTQFPALVIDAASSVIQVGLLPGGSPAAAQWQTSGEEAGVAIFKAVRALGVALADIRTFIFCDGPGSVLGIRTAAMALRTWQVLDERRPLYAYCSLALVAHALGREDVAVIADARRESWHCYRIGAGLTRVPAAALCGELVMPEFFRHWSALPPQVRTVPYRVGELVAKVWDDDLLMKTDAPDAFLHEEPSYVTWTPQIHRAPGMR